MSSNKAISSALVSSPPLLVQSKTGNQNKSVMCHEGCSLSSAQLLTTITDVIQFLTKSTNGNIQERWKTRSLLKWFFAPVLIFSSMISEKARQTGRVPYAPVIEWFTMSEAVPSFYWPFCRHLLFYWAFPWVTVWLTKICFYADAMSMLGWVSALCGYPWKLRKQKF